MIRVTADRLLSALGQCGNTMVAPGTVYAPRGEWRIFGSRATVKEALPLLSEPEILIHSRCAPPKTRVHSGAFNRPTHSLDPVSIWQPRSPNRTGSIPGSSQEICGSVSPDPVPRKFSRSRISPSADNRGMLCYGRG